MDDEELRKQAAKEICELILKPIVDSMVKMAAEYVANEIHKQDKGRTPPFWANNWRSNK